MLTCAKYCYNCGLSGSNKKDAQEIYCEKLENPKISRPFKCKIPKYYIKRETEVRKTIPEYLEETEKNYQTKTIIEWSVFCCIVSIVAGLLIAQYVR